MKICVWSMIAAAGLACSAHGQVIISEIVDGPLSGGTPKMMELTNVGSTPVTLGTGDLLKNYNNGGLTGLTFYDFGGNAGANNVTLQPGQSWTISTTAGQSQWIAAFGPFNLASVFGAGPNVNGDDVITLENALGIVDIYGVIGERPVVGDTWNYQDSFARRVPQVCSPSATFVASQWISRGSDGLELPVPNGSIASYGTAWTNNTSYNISPNTHQNVCSGNTNDCNGNGIEDYAETGANPSIDLDGNRIPDSCDVAVYGATDCSADGVPDVIQIFLGTFADANANGIPDGCEGILFDCNGNFVEDATDISGGTSQDCNANGVPDECDYANGTLTDANANGIADACEGAAVVEASVTGTVTATGVRADPNGSAFFNVQGADQANLPPVENGANRSYGGLRFDRAAFAAVFDATFGAGQWDVDSIYLTTSQSNAGFTTNGDIELFHSNNDSIDITPGNATTLFDNFATDFADRQSALAFTFTQIATGTVEHHLVYDSNSSNTAGAAAFAAEIDGGSGEVTAVIKDITTTVSATFAGRTHNTLRGPTFVVFAKAAVGGCPWQVTGCTADQDGDDDVDSDDIVLFFSNFENGETCGDQDGDEDVDSDDIVIFFGLFEQGGC